MRFLFCLLLSLSLSCNAPQHEIFQGQGEANAPLSSKTIVMIHGMYLTPKTWDAWKQYFEAAGYTVYAPAWPLHDDEPKNLRDKHPDPHLGRLRLDDIIAHYQTYIKALPEKPILIGHSMGGLITQILLQMDLGLAGIAIDSAPPNGLISAHISFLRSTWPILSPFANDEEPALLTESQFHYAFTNCLSEDVSKQAYDVYVAPESRLVGKSPLHSITEIAFDRKSQPLLFIAGGQDHIIPASLNYANFKKYARAPSLTEFKLFEDRCHWIIGQEKWEDVAAYIKNWLQSFQ